MRRVENLIPAAGTGSATLAVSANKTMTLEAGKYLFSMGAGAGTVTFSGTGGATGNFTANAENRTVASKTITAGTLIITASVATLVDLMVENTTGRADTDTPSKYVSIGVANADTLGPELVTNGVNLVNTTGYYSPRNVSTLSAESGNLRVTAGSTATMGHGYELTLEVGANYVYAYSFIEGTATTANARIRYGRSSLDTITGEVDQVKTSSGVIFFLATSATMSVGAIITGHSAGQYYEMALTSVKKVELGANVDGVKNYSTLNGNTVDSNGIVTENVGALIEITPPDYVRLSGNTGSFASSPDSVAASIISDITLIAYATCDDWGEAGHQVAVGKRDESGNASYGLRIRNGGLISFITFEESGAAVSSESTAVTGFPSGTGHWLRCSWDDSADAVNYYISDNAVTDLPAAAEWVLLGDADVSHVSDGIKDSTALLEIGSQEDGTESLWAGKIYRAIAIASTDPTATPAVDFNAADGNWQTPKSFTSKTTGEVYTVNGDAYLESDNTKGMPELVREGDFSSSVYWSLQSGVTITGGKLVIDSTTDYAPLAVQNLSFREGAAFKLIAKVSGYVQGEINVRQGTVGAGNIIGITANGTYPLKFIGSAESTLEIRSSAGPTEANVEIISIKPVSVNYFEPAGVMLQGAATEISGRSADLDNWAGTATASKNAAGLKGDAGAAFDVADTSAIETQSIFDDAAIVSSTNKQFLTCRLEYLDSPLVYPRILFRLISGTTPLAQGLIFNQSDGSFLETQTEGTVESVVREGRFWVVRQSITDNASGNVLARVDFNPAFNTDGTATVNSAAQGSVVVASLEFYTTTWSFQPILTTGGTTKTVSADNGYTLPLSYFNDLEGSVSFRLTPEFDNATGATQGIISIATNSISQPISFRDTVSRQITIWDGTNGVGLSVAWNLGESPLVKLRYGNGTMRFSVGGIVSASVAFSSFSPSGAITIGKDLTLAFSMDDLRFWGRDRMDSWL
jgi:hypothetical protein